ncbi:flavohemoglobin expression-modulating QEGLA motif protein [Brumimicrobium mesophilum]|uniref:flavohemoglobin expression-modulating QEGLA motif protein n=1 Tax=Brumimicrobium mesophilum TaxID=392717 RepID=UPI001F401427|nr:tyrosine/phenylalanine carboxypeptidase domain-containing protein [Brumimicrobium mesophilum]
MEIKTETERIIAMIDKEKRTISELPYGGFLSLEHDVPFLMIYRNIENDEGTLRLARSGGSYLIINDENFHYFYSFLNALSKKMAEKYGAFLMLELFSGPEDSKEFVIKGPSHKLPISLNVMEKNLKKIESKDLDYQITCRIEQTNFRQTDESLPLFEIESLKNNGATLLGLEIPPVYRDENGKLFPVYFREFRDSLTIAIQKTIFEFLRIQTSSGITDYHLLGRGRIHEKVLEIDKALTSIQKQYQFLLLVAPVNIQNIRKTFFKSDFKQILNYHYRFLPVDPDILKRELFNLRIDEIDDPAIAYLFNEKREEIAHELSMLKERGTKNFFYSSVRLYEGVTTELENEAKHILNDIPELIEPEDTNLIDAIGFKRMAEAEFNFFKSQDSNFSSKVHIKDSVNIIMVSNGELYLPSDYTMNVKEAQALIQHEIGTHVLTYFNGCQQPLSQLSVGLAGYDPLQEGLAVLAEYLSGGLTGNRLRILAGRVIAGAALLKGADFAEIFNSLKNDYGFSKENAFNITSRMFQGGGFLKDVIYLKGLYNLKVYLQNGGDFEILLTGKFALKHTDAISELVNRGLLKAPKLLPKYMYEDHFKEALEKFKNTETLSKLI